MSGAITERELNMETKTKKLVGVGVFTGIVIVLQVIASFIKVGPFSITLCLIPIVCGAALYGWWAGAWLGFVFSMVVLISGDAAAFLAVNIPGTIVTVIAKGTLAGLVSGGVYALLDKAIKGNAGSVIAAVIAGILCPVTNTGIFLLGCKLFFMPTITGWAEASGFPNAGNYMIYGLVGVNFLIEVGVNAVCTPAVTQIVKFGKKNA